MNSLLIALCTVATVLNVVMLVLTVRYAQGARATEAKSLSVFHELQGMRANVIALERECDQLARGQKKLHGRVAHLPTFDEWQEMTAAGYTPEEEQLDLLKPNPQCDNWNTAQLEGPLSDAAKCQCAYCTSMRARRRSVLPASLGVKVGA